MKNELPATRYYGSKRKIINNIWEIILSQNFEFNSVLDLFGGTGTFAYKAKLEGKKVFYNDIFRFNYFIGKALIQNNKIKLSNRDISFLIAKQEQVKYKYYIKEYYYDIYYLNHENEIFDIIVQNIAFLKDNYKKAMAFYALFQTALIKRPFNSFHRKNLSLRTRDVPRKFGNKVTWEKDTIETFKAFCYEINKYVFSNNQPNKSVNYSALACQETADLIYIDPPYINKKGMHVDYHSRYHFLEALTHYDDFVRFIDFNKLNKEVVINKSEEFENKNEVYEHVDRLISKYKEKIIVFSYRNQGIPSPGELKEIFLTQKKTCKEFTIHNHYYALNRSNNELHELVYILQ